MTLMHGLIKSKLYKMEEARTLDEERLKIMADMDIEEGHSPVKLASASGEEQTPAGVIKL